MQLGFVSAILPDQSLDEVLKIAADLGYDCIEACCWPTSKADRRYAGVTHVDVVDFTAAKADELHAKTAAAGVGFSGLGYYPNPLTPDRDEAEKSIAHLYKVIDAAAMLGLGRINTFIGRDWMKNVDENWPRFLEVWRPLVKHAEERRVRIGIENCPMIFSYDEWPGGKNLASSPNIWRRMFADVPSEYFGLNYDPSHMVLQNMCYLKPLRDFKEKLFHIHAKDV
ncbi:MAG: sugar phosphate isomerase/epimerase family protein, partial [Planctomycetia bacterium]